MINKYIAEIEKASSTPRLNKYRSQGGSPLDTAVNYFWNIALAEALYPSLATLEVALRNSIHDALTTRERTDMWFRKVLEPRQLRDFADACTRLYDRLKREPTSGQIVAELSFGFWTTLLSQPYHQSLWTKKHAALVRAVFPHLPPTPNSRRYIHDHCNPLRVLRNRVMHHEPILYGLEWGTSTYPINELHKKTLKAIGWINPTVQTSTILFDHFPDVYQNGRQRIENDLKSHLGLA